VTRTRGWLLAVLWLLALFAALEHPILTREAVPLWDARDLHAPNQILVADHARAGRLVGWNPWAQAGAPDFADPQSGAFSPVSIALGFATGGGTFAFALLWFAHWLLGGVGLLLLARRLDAPPWGALVAALGWLYCGLYVAQAQHLPILISFSWLPFVLARADVAARDGRWLAAAQAGALFGLSALYGYPAMTIASPFVVALWVAARWERAPAAHALRMAVGFAVVGLVVLAPAYAAILRETPGYTDETGPKPRDVALASDALAPGALATLASPSFPPRKIRNPGLWPQTDATTCSLYLGAAATCLALFGALGARGDRLRIALVALATLSLAIAVGDATPLRGWLYDWLPPWRYFRHAALFRVYALLALALLAACGAADLARGAAATWRRFALVGAAAAVAAWIAYLAAIRQAPWPPPHDGLAHAHVALAWLAVPTIAWLAPALERRRRHLAGIALVAVASLDAAATHALSTTLYSTNPKLVQAWRAIDLQHDPDLVLDGMARSLETSFGGEPSGMNVALKAPTLRGYHALRHRFHARWLEEPSLAAAALETPRARPRTWFARDAALLPPSDAAWDVFLAAARARGPLPLVVHEPDAMLARPPDAALPSPGAIPLATPIEVALVRYETGALAFDVTAPSDGWLLVTDRWARSWRAAVNGTETPIYGGDFLFRAVRVGAGTSRVEFRYEPRGYGALVAASWGMLAVVGAASGVARAGARS
jgi:hypothetical protein